MYDIQSESTDATYNLALEQYVFDELSREHSYLMLWQNANAVIVGRFQNAVAEINADYVRNRGVQVVRRLSGGGAVYHDMGNINYSIITDAKDGGFDFAFFCQPVIHVLQSLGVNAEISGRNDMTIEGMKFSGNSQYIRQGRVLHHGTILFDSDMQTLSKVLVVSGEKIESKGTKSIRSRVANVRPYLKTDCDSGEFLKVLRVKMIEQLEALPIPPGMIEINKVKRLQEERYAAWRWNYGASPAYNVSKRRRFEGVGEMEVRMDIEQGLIKEIIFFGDYFASIDQEDLTARLRGVCLNGPAITDALRDVNIGAFFAHLEKEDFISLLT